MHGILSIASVERAFEASRSPETPWMSQDASRHVEVPALAVQYPGDMCLWEEDS